ncbi:MAG: 3'-5' exonuclease domain-containing protein 2 [Bacteroidales bacterium]|nr:3'-5' exonuclease domain-containing protein 2 [Bacteroidales bacterium]
MTENKYSPNITNEELMTLPLYAYEGEVVCVDTMEMFYQVKDELFLEPLWGFDTETKPCFRKGVENRKNVALLQLSSREKTYIFRLSKIGLPKELCDFLSSDRFTKIGLSSRDDIKGLQKLTSFEPAGFIDLQSIVSDYGIEEKGLRKLAAIVLGVRISKSQQLSNWESDALTEKQIRYASTDSWVTRQIYVELKRSAGDGNII